MHVEECCQAILCSVLPQIDPGRQGLCIDVGVGTFDLYCELFASIGFDTVAVEPLPTPAIKMICRSLGIVLIESCMYDNDGTQTMYTGTYKDSENLNLSSIRADWWGSSSHSVQVRSMTLATLLTTINARLITCLKLDVEGVESVIIKQLQRTHAFLLPAVVMFEYGGGGTRDEEKAGWSETGIHDTLSCLQILKDLNYRTTILVDSSPESKERVIDLAGVEVTPDALFHPRAVYGNAVCFLDQASDPSWIEGICALYRDNGARPPKPLSAISRTALLTWRLRRMMRRFYR
jgi:FkbM family methyltransferase